MASRNPHYDADRDEFLAHGLTEAEASLAADRVERDENGRRRFVERRDERGAFLPGECALRRRVVLAFIPPGSPVFVDLDPSPSSSGRPVKPADCPSTGECAFPWAIRHVATEADLPAWVSVRGERRGSCHVCGRWTPTAMAAHWMVAEGTPGQAVVSRHLCPAHMDLCVESSKAPLPACAASDLTAPGASAGDGTTPAGGSPT